MSGVASVNESKFSVIFRGSTVENGEIDVRDLAPALLALGDLLQAANDVIHGVDSRLEVKISATHRGSFVVDLSIITTFIETIFSYAKSQKDGISAANELTDLILKIGAGASGGLFMLLKWLRGRKPDKIEEKNGKVSVHIGDQYFIADHRTIELAESIEVRKNARRLMAVLERDGIDSLSIRQGDGDEILFDREDVASFELRTEQEQQLLDETRRMTVQIIALSFKEDNKWRLTDGGEPFSAVIEDIDFINRIARDEIRFGKNDYLICDVRERQSLGPKGLRKDRSIIRVLDHRPAAAQMKLL